MLNKLLELIHQGGSVTLISLSTQLDTSPKMVEMMIEELTRRGLLKYTELQSNCDSSSCGTCYLANSCKPKLQKIWTTTLEIKD